MAYQSTRNWMPKCPGMADNGGDSASRNRRPAWAPKMFDSWLLSKEVECMAERMYQGAMTRAKAQA